MAIAKVILNGVTQMDVTQKTVTAGSMLSGATALKNDGTDITGNIASQAAQTIHPSTTDQTIASGKYLTGAQTIKAVTTTNLTAANIVSGVTVKIGDSTDDDCVASVTGTAETGGGGGNDFVITFTQNASTGIYEPDCTFAEAKAAYDAGEKVVSVASDMSLCTLEYDKYSNGFLYTVEMSYFPSDAQAIGRMVYLWTSTGVVVAEDPEQQSPPAFAYFTFNATAVPADVASGKVFYNANGYQTGTASGGGSDADYIAMIERTTAVTSLPEGVTTIGNSAFRNCSSLALTSLPSGVTTIGESAFTGCSYLALTSLPSGLRSIGTSAFTDCTRIAITSFPNTMTSVGTAAFARCRNILTISCNGAITTLGTNAFNGNASDPMQLAHASFPNLAVTSLSTVFGSTGAAQACQLLEDADIGNTKAIAANAFANCYKLQTLVLRRSDAICTLNNVSAFTNTPIRGYSGLSGTIYVPSALISTYQTATNWSTIYGEGHVTFAAIEGSQYEL